MKTTLRRGSGTAQSGARGPDEILFMGARRCILDSISEENDALKSNSFGAIFCLFVNALRCILDSISEENYPFKSHCFSTIFTWFIFNYEEWVDRGPHRARKKNGLWML